MKEYQIQEMFCSMTEMEIEQFEEYVDFFESVIVGKEQLV